jgi:WD40 repeat protein
MEQVLGGGAPAQNVVERLITARLLIASEEQRGEDRIEVIHEALLTSWPRLVEWQQEDAENARMRHQLRAAARQWDERGRGRGMLWRREALMEYRLWRSRYPGRLTETEEAFAAASLADEARGRLARRLIVAGAFVVLSAGLVVLYRANNVAVERAAEAKRLLAMSHEEQGRQLLLTGDPVRAIVYLDKAYQEGASGPALQFMLGRATRALDAQVAVLPHSDWVREAHFSPDGLRAVTASYDRTARIWDAGNGMPLAVLEGASDRVLSARYSPDGSQVVTASIDGWARIYDGDGHLLRSLQVGPPAPEAQADFSPDGKLIAATIGAQGKIWSTSDYQFVGELNGHTGTIQQFKFHPDGNSVFTASRDGTVKRWDRHGRLLLSINATESSEPLLKLVFSLSLSSDGGRLVTAGLDQTFKVWNSNTGQLLSRAPDSDGLLNWVAMSPDGSEFVGVSNSRVGKIRDSRSGVVSGFLEGHGAPLRFVKYAQDSSLLLTTSGDGTAKLWKSSNSFPIMTMAGHLDTVISADLSPDKVHAITASYDGTARIWDTRKSPRLSTFSEPLGTSVGAWSAEGQRILVAGFAGAIKVWQVEGRRLLYEVNAEADKYFSGALAPNEKLLALPGEKEIRVIELPSGRTVTALKLRVGGIHSLAFSPDSKWLATGGQDWSVKIWDGRDGALLRSFGGHSGPIISIAFDSEGKRLVSGGSDRRVYVWDLITGTRVLAIDDFRGDIFSVDFSPDGSRLVTASRDRRLVIWDVKTGKILQAFQEAKQANINSAHFNRDGTFLITGDIAGVMAVWDVRTGRLLSNYFEARDILLDAQFSPDGRDAMTRSAGPNVVLWDVRSDTRSSADISAYVRCRVPFRLEAENLVRTQPETSRCGR